MADLQKQVKSKERVAKHGEVFTAPREVNAMLDLVKPETERIESRFLEPACGNGNFLAEILERKLKVVAKRYKKYPDDYERYAVLALTSIYGIDILQDNVSECRHRLFEIWEKYYHKNLKKMPNGAVQNTAQFILQKNILCGNALSLKKVDPQGNDLNEPIIFAEWSFVVGNKIKRRDFRLDVLIGENVDLKNYDHLASDKPSEPKEDDNFIFDSMTHKRIPKPRCEYPAIDYRRITEND